MERPESIETALDEALDALVAGDPEAVRRVQEKHGNAPELTALVDSAGQIQGALAGAAPSAEARARHLRMIREAAARQARPAPRRHPIRRFVLRPVLVAGLILVLAAPAVLALSARALPGEALYPAKIALEDARLALAQDPAKDVGLHAEFAQRRVDEIARLSERGLPDRAVLAPVLADLRDHHQQAASGIVALRREGLTVGPLQERVAVVLQQSKERLAAVGTDAGCGTAGVDGSCTVISLAFNHADQALRRVDGGLAGVAPAAPDGGAPAVPDEQAGDAVPPAGGGGAQPDSAPEAPPAPGGSQGGGQDQPGTGTGQAPAPPDGQAPAPPEGQAPAPPEGQAPAPPAPEQPSPPAPQAPPAVVPPAAAQPLQVEIDIKPADGSNTLDVIRRRELPVVVRSTPGFDAASLDLSSVCFGDDPTDPANSDCSPGQTRLRDVDRDGDQDLVIMFGVQETGIDLGDTEACLSGRTTDGRTVKGCDKVSVLDAAGPRAAGTGKAARAPAAQTRPGQGVRSSDH